MRLDLIEQDRQKGRSTVRVSLPRQERAHTIHSAKYFSGLTIFIAFDLEAKDLFLEK